MAVQSAETIQFLQIAYNENGRQYHNINHIKFLLAKLDTWLDHYNSNDLSQQKFDELSQIYKDTREAIWWHDAWYSIWDAPGVNERESANLFNAFVNNKGVSDITEFSRQRIEKAILATADHLLDQDLKDEDIVTKLMLDVDLASFGGEYELVQYNSETVSKEYEPTGASRLKLLQGRVAFLEKLEKRKNIFYTDFFREKYELNARVNINRSIMDAKVEIALNGG